MNGKEFGDDRLRAQLADHYVAWRDGEVVIKAETSDELYDRLDELPLDDQDRVVVEYLRRTDVVYVY